MSDGSESAPRRTYPNPSLARLGLVRSGAHLSGLAAEVSWPAQLCWRAEQTMARAGALSCQSAVGLLGPGAANRAHNNYSFWRRLQPADPKRLPVGGGGLKLAPVTVPIGYSI